MIDGAQPPAMTSVSELRIGDIASNQVLTTTPETSLRELIRLFAESRVSSIVVIEDEFPVGIVTERDLLRLACSGYSEDKPVRAVMSAPLTTARNDLDFSSAHALLSSHGIRHLVLVDAHGHLAGVASETDFRRHIGNDLFASIQTLHAVMEPTAEMLSPEHSLAKVLETMAAHRLDHVLLGEDQYALGIITERDVPRLLAAHLDPERVRAGEVMSRPLHTVRGEIPAAEVARRMAQAGLRHLVVEDASGRAVGVVSQHRMLERLSSTLMEQGRNRLASQLDLLLEMTGIGTWEYDHRQDRLLRSPALNKMLGFPADHGPESLDALVGRSSASEQRRMSALFREFHSGRQRELNTEYLARDARKQPRWIGIRGRVVESADEGGPLRSAGVAIDINEQKEAEQRLLATERRFRFLLENLPLAIAHLNIEGEIVFLNRRFVADFGYTRQEIPHLASWWQKVCPDRERRQHAIDRWNIAFAQATNDDTLIRAGDFDLVCQDGSQCTVEISGMVFDEEILVSFIDVSERREQQRLLEFGNAILKMISVGGELPLVLDHICRDIEARYPELRCSILLLDEDSRRLRYGAAPSLPDSWRVPTESIAIGPEVGACGSAAFHGWEVFSTDIASDPLWRDFRDAAGRHGLAACWSTPIVSAEGKVLGTFAIYWFQSHPTLTQATRRHVATATSLAAIAIQKQRRDAALQRLHQSLTRAESIGQMGSWRWDIVQHRAQWSPQMFLLFALDPHEMPPDFEHFIALVHPDEQGQVRQALERMLAGGEPEIGIYRRHPERGPLRYLQPSYTLVRDADGQPLAYEGTLLDVTAAVLNEEKLHRQIEELRRWQKVMLGRESRVLELKREVNALLLQHGQAPRYGSVIAGGDERHREDGEDEGTA